MRYGFTIYANTEEDAELIRQEVINQLQIAQRDSPERCPEWDIDSDVTDFDDDEAGD